MSLVQSLHTVQVARGEQSVTQCLTHRPANILTYVYESGVSAMVVGAMGDAITTTRWFAQQIIFSHEHWRPDNLARGHLSLLHRREWSVC